MFININLRVLWQQSRMTIGPWQDQERSSSHRGNQGMRKMNESLRIFCRTQLMIEEEERIGQLEQREQSMRQLESDIVDVNTIFKVIGFFSLC